MFFLLLLWWELLAGGAWQSHLISFFRRNSFWHFNRLGQLIFSTWLFSLSLQFSEIILTSWNLSSRSLWGQLGLIKCREGRSVSWLNVMMGFVMKNRWHFEMAAGKELTLIVFFTIARLPKFCKFLLKFLTLTSLTHQPHIYYLLNYSSIFAD